MAQRQWIALFPFLMEPALKRIGIVELNGQSWTGGLHFMRLLKHVLRDACRVADTELVILTDHATGGAGRRNLEDADRIVTVTPRRRVRGEKFLRSVLHLSDKCELLETARKNNVEVLLPLLSIPENAAKLKTVGWIPDFQHVHLPDYFSEADRRARDLRFRLLAERASLVMLTSQDALEDFVAFAPDHAHKARVISFPAFLSTKSMADDPHVTVKNFNLPEKFALVANQFWRHKNHQMVIEAVAQLRQKNIRVPVVMTGLPADYRDPNNQIFSQILQAIARAGLGEQVVLLGLVSDEELLALMRAAAVIIQPSRFEGWSTIVQNTKALGRPLICSDIAAHREQAPSSLGFFPCDRADALAEILATYWPRIKPGPDPEAERQGLAAEHEAVNQYGHSVLKLCLEAFNL
jgi:glycosyltransferase involved in cell wall biosynthesis